MKWTSSLSLPKVAQTIPQKTAPAENELVADGVNVIRIVPSFCF
jgi:hypothetical protein